MTKYKKADVEKAREELLHTLKWAARLDRDGRPIVNTILRHVSASGMTRDMTLLVVDADGEHRYLTWRAAQVLGWPMKGDYLRVTGCGMDMGFHVVYSLARCLYGDGYALTHRWL